MVSRIPARSVSTTVLSLAAILGSMGVSLAEEATYSLRYKFQTGQFLYYEVDNAMKIVTQYDSAKEEVTNTSQAWKQLRVVSVDEAGNALLEPMVERVRMSAIKDDEDVVKYDSADEGTEPPLQFRDVKDTIGKVMARVNVTPNGELIKVFALADNNPGLKAAAEKNDPRLNFLVVMPRQPVRINDSWNDRFKTEVSVDKGLKQEVLVQRTYTLTAVNGAIATIKLKTSVVTPLDDPQIKVQLIQRTPGGFIEFDLDKGLIVTMKTSVDETVFGAFGPKSSMSAATRSSEKLLPTRPELKVVSRPAK